MAFFNRKNSVDPSSEHRDWELVASIASQSLQEQKKARRWGIFFKLLTFAYLFFILMMVLNAPEPGGESSNNGEPHTAIIRVDGLIASGEEANANNIVDGLRRAFENENASAIMLIINSPGGSPVQAGYVTDEVNRLKLIYPDTKVYAVITELGASGGYYIAASADEIYADKASLVGSIGVTAAGFGFVDLMEKLGVERRNFTSGEHKSFLDPFSPLKEDEQRFWEGVLDSTHQQFISVVREGRGDRLIESEDLFSGLIWNGEQAQELGLVDGLGSPGYVAREIIGEEEMIDYTLRPSFYDEFAERFGVAVGMGIGKIMASINEAPIQLR